LKTIKIEVKIDHEEGIQSILVNGVEKIDDNGIVSIARGSQEEWLIAEDIYKDHDLVLVLTE